MKSNPEGRSDDAKLARLAFLPTAKNGFSSLAILQVV